MVGIIIASHGDLAKGLYHSAEMIFGKQEDVFVCTLEPSAGPESIKEQMEKAIASLSQSEEVLIIADLWGGTPFNQASMLIEGHEKWAIVTGASLPMVIEAYAGRLSMESAHDIAKHIVPLAKESIKAKPEGLVAKPVAKATKKAAAIPEGTVRGDGKINYVYTRVDTRLLHGQVATTWTKDKQPQRIVIASDSVSKDELRKTMVIQAAPPGVSVHVVPLDQLVKISNDPRLGGTRMMVLFETPQDALYCIEKGVKLPEVCLGSMAHSEGKAVVSRALAMDKDDLETIEKLVASGARIYGQVVPSESVLKIEDLIKKAKELL